MTKIDSEMVNIIGRAINIPKLTRRKISAKNKKSIVYIL